MEDKQYTEQDYQSFFDLLVKTPGETEEVVVQRSLQPITGEAKKSTLKYKFTCMCGGQFREKREL